MPKPDHSSPLPAPAPVTPPTLPPDFPDIPQNPSSELQPPSDPSATPDKVAGTTPELPQPETPEAIIWDEMRRKNARLRGKINSVLEQHPELRDATDELALTQGTQVQVRVPFLERIQANLQERARAIIERRPDLEHLFDD
jgi:outer membrane protein TolC